MKTRVEVRWHQVSGYDLYYVQEWLPEEQRKIHSILGVWNTGETPEQAAERERLSWYTVPAHWSDVIATPHRDEAIELAQRIAAGGKSNRIIAEYDFP